MSLRRYDLQQYIHLLDEQQLIQYIQADQNALEREVEHLSYDSRDMKPGGLFICKGTHFLPRYLQEAVDRGAFCYISEKEYDLSGK
ncbi:MAG: UDP-N-acetylmuramoyl-L-alanyl-D-glutamate--L-lysine ligase, partial [Clostridiales Family XIII bacterium]|nr:UDP-N-acetylmuramoyl-L-alanyl-D-glutamate--L-lysine ligase [Clostridiales Family XIII bacterium]